MKGWLTREQVEAYPKTLKETTKFNPYNTAYIIDLEEIKQLQEPRPRRSTLFR